ncbi:MAG: 1-acyl-sn-glycerol-3-phosphate acyltransferase, partial [Merismopedia sp. SIO2A8]|nr:1-acyl-sn-glycerol-3-phosphate acyltransferase [Merismopedia sp. SIO2A8]
LNGLQGWLIRQLGGFPVNPRQPAIASLRFGMDILKDNGMMVMFPEGAIFRDRCLHPLKPGLARLAIRAENTNPQLGVQVVPMNLIYSDAIPSKGTSITVQIGPPIEVKFYRTSPTAFDSCKRQAQQLTQDLAIAFVNLGAQIAND